MQISCEQPCQAASEPIRLAVLWWMFLQIASTSFGGFMAMISVVQNVVVARRKLLSDNDVLDAVSLASVLPGPTAINVIAFIGYRLRGVTGAVVCVCASVLPAFLLMLLLSIAYQHWGQMPAVSKAFMGVVPAVMAIVMAAALRMCRSSVTSIREGVLAAGAAAIALGFPGIFSMLAVMSTAAVAGRWWYGEAGALRSTRGAAGRGTAPAAAHPLLRVNAHFLLLSALPVLVSPWPGLATGPLLSLFTAFASMSLLMFGGGYVFIPLLQQVVVDGHGWVTQQEFIDAIALGQVTPGPVMISATFIGYKVAGLAGAIVATLGMFAPAVVPVLLCARLLANLKNSVNVQAALRGVRAATVGMVFAAVVLIGKSAAPNGISVALFFIALLLLMRFRIEALWIVPTAGLIGLIAY